MINLKTELLVWRPSKPKNGTIYDLQEKPQLGVIHAMGEFIMNDNGKDGDQQCYYAPDWLDDLNCAAHFYITPSGVIIQTLDIDVRGAHARGYNVQSIGIEFLVPGVHNINTFYQAIKKPYLTDEAIGSGLLLVSYLMSKRVTIWKQHSELSPERKRDPGAGFPDWFIEKAKTLM